MDNSKLALGMALVAVVIAIGSSFVTSSKVQSLAGVVEQTMNFGATSRFTNGISIATTSQSNMFNVGSGSATSTVDMGKVCFRVTTRENTVLYYSPSSNNTGVSGWATSTASCF